MVKVFAADFQDAAAELPGDGEGAVFGGGVRDQNPFRRKGDRTQKLRERSFGV